MTAFLISYKEINALKVNKNKSREFLLMNLTYSLFMQWRCDFWNSLAFDPTDE